MAIFAAYFDASGRSDNKQKAGSLWVSGFVSTVEKWLRFEERWLELLSQHDITPPFHMTDFMAGRREYARWKGDAVRQDAFLLAAAKIIHQETNKPFSIGMYLEDLRRFYAQYEVPGLQDPQAYTWCALQAVNATKIWTRNRLKAKTVSGADTFQCFFEEGDLYSDTFVRIARDTYGIIPQFLGKECVPFQACDLLAWEHRNMATNIRLHGSGYTRSSYNALQHYLPNDAMRYTSWRGLAQTAKEFAFPRRTRPIPP
jgi:hypothetical protein